jgi:chemotaxis protein CheZ
MENSGIDREYLLTATKQLIEHLEKGDDQDIEKSLDELSSIRENKLFQELGKLTRELHDSIRNFQLDERFNDIAETEIPDAKERLEYVLTMTQQSADKTLTAVEHSQPVLDRMSDQIQDMETRWSQFLNKELNAEEFRNLAADISEFFKQAAPDLSMVNSHLTTVLMAQDFQDLTGQIIRRVINLVADVESNLVNLIRLQGESSAAPAVPKKDAKAKAEENKGKLEGPQIPGKEAEDVMANQDDVDDLLASLGF